MSSRDRWIVALALAVGTGIYLTLRAPVLRLHRPSFLDASTPLVSAPGLPAWVADSLPFALWSLAGGLALRSTRAWWVIPVVGIGAEIGQLLGWVPGTFDPVDLLVLTLAAAVVIGLRPKPAAAEWRVTSSHGVWRTAAVLGVFGLLAAATEESEEHRAEREAKEAEAMAGMEVYFTTMASVYETLSAQDPASLSPRRCDQAAMLEAPGVEHGHLNLRTISLEFLARFGAEKEAWTAPTAPWDFIDDSIYAGHFAQHPDDRSDYSVKDTAQRIDETFMAERYLIVIRDVGDDGRIAPVMKSDHFESGYFAGWMQVVDQRDGTVLCQAPFEVESGESIDFGGRLDGKDPEKEMWEDFEDNFERALLDQLPPKVEISTSYGSILF